MDLIRDVLDKQLIDRHGLELSSIQKMRLIAYAEQQRKPGRRRVQVRLQHRPIRCDSCSSADENRIARRLPQHEHPQRLAHLDAITRFHFE